MTGKGFGPDPKLSGFGDRIALILIALCALLGWFLLSSQLP